MNDDMTKILKELGIDSDKTNNKDEIYIKVIEALLVKEKLIDYNYVNDIFSKLDFKQMILDFNKNEDLKKLFYEVHNYIRKYIIYRRNDLFDEQKINFYYNLIKYILKSNLNIQLILKTKNRINKILNSNEKLFEKYKEEEDKNIKERLEYIIEEINKIEYSTNISSNIKNESSLIIIFKKIIGDHNKNKVEYIKEIEDSIFLSVGADNRINIYDNYNKKYVKKCYQKIEGIIINNNKNVLGDKILTVFFKDGNSSTNLKDNINEDNIDKDIQKYNNYILCNNVYYNIPNLLENNNNIYFNYYNGFKINKNIIIFPFYYNELNNSKLIFYDISKKKEFKSIDEYNIRNSKNSLSLFSIDNGNGKILLGACKKIDNKEQKNENGILLVNLNLDLQEFKFNKLFYNTNNFEVFCFCQIYKKQNEKIFNELIKTDYFLVGGFYPDKSEGIIKLYKIIKSQKIFDTKIEYIQDININKNDSFESFNNAISSIIQTKKEGNLLITCYDGNVYLFSPPDLSNLKE